MTEKPDHVKEAEAIQLKIYQNMSVEQKWKIAMDLYDTAWKIKSAMMREEHPDWNEAQIHKAVREIFLYARS